MDPVIPIFSKTLENKRFMRSVCCAGQSLSFAEDWYCTASSKAHCAFACEPDGSQAIKRFLIVLLKNSIKLSQRGVFNIDENAALWYNNINK